MKVKRFRLCLNCLRSGHFNIYCRANSCKNCKSKLHVLLHLKVESRKDELVGVGHSNENFDNLEESKVLLASNKVLNTVLMSTAMIEVIDGKNKVHVFRAVLDYGSQLSYIAANL